MKSGRISSYLLIVIAILFFSGFAMFAIVQSGNDAQYTDKAHRFGLDYYGVTYDIASDCEISVEEILTVHYYGDKSTGFMRDIPSGKGANVKDVKVEGVELLSGGNSVPYYVRIDSNDFITVDIGDGSIKKDKCETYRLTYKYLIDNGVVRSGLLPLTPVGNGWECDIEVAEVTLLLPRGFVSADRYVGAAGYDISDKDFTVTEENGRQVIKTVVNGLKKFEGITFDLHFEKGAISPYFDYVPYLFALGAAGLLLVTVLLRFPFASKTRLTPVATFMPPEGMDPLIMGKYIDNKVNPTDVTAMIFYWADKGYLKINLENPDNPTLIRLKFLPKDAESYEQIVFSGLFRGGDAVSVSSLKYSFYKTYERATAAVNQKANKLYESKSIGISVLMAVMAGIFAGLGFMISAMVSVSPRLLYLYGFAATVPMLVIYGLSETAFYEKLKHSPKANALSVVLIILGIAAFTAVMCFFVPASVMPLAPKIIFTALCFCSVSVSVLIITRTKEHNARLNFIVGFRNFILYAEKDRLEKLLESDPQYFYRVLPYAQVLNVSKIWTDKFNDITVSPPDWAIRSPAETVFDFMILNSAIRRSTAMISRGMTARPSSGGAHGYHGSFGGHSGGGFGGGGGRGR